MRARRQCLWGFLFMGISKLMRVSYNHVLTFLIFIDLGTIWFSEKQSVSLQTCQMKWSLISWKGVKSKEMENGYPWKDF